MMLTLIPYEDSVLTAQTFTAADLRQQIEASIKWLSMVRTNEFHGWDLHSLGRLWCGEEEALAFHTYALGVEFESRRHKPSKVTQWLMHHYPWLQDKEPDMPAWWGVADLHISHRALMIGLRPGQYDDVFRGVVGSLDCCWPG